MSDLAATGCGGVSDSDPERKESICGIAGKLHNQLRGYDSCFCAYPHSA